MPPQNVKNKAPKGVGRPKLPERQRRTVNKGVRFKMSEMKRIESAARRAGVKVADFIREAALKAAKAARK